MCSRFHRKTSDVQNGRGFSWKVRSSSFYKSHVVKTKPGCRQLSCDLLRGGLELFPWIRQRGKSRKESESSYMKNLNANTQAAISTSLQVLKRKRRFFKALCPQLESAQLRLVTSCYELVLAIHSAATKANLTVGSRDTGRVHQFNPVLFVLRQKSSCLRAPAGAPERFWEREDVEVRRTCSGPTVCHTKC